jgi:hypothetical protein
MSKARIEFTPTSEDYAGATRASVLNVRRSWVFAVSAFGLTLVFLYYFVPWRAARRAAREERLRAKTLYEIDDDGVLIRNDYAETKLDWGSFREFVITEDYYLLVYTLNRSMVQFIPRRAFASEHDEEAFRAILEASLPEVQSKTIGRARLAVSLLIVAVVVFFALACLASWVLQIL